MVYQKRSLLAPTAVDAQDQDRDSQRAGVALMRAILFGLTGYGNFAFEALRAQGVEVPIVVTRRENGPHPHYACEQLGDVASAAGSKVYYDADPDRDDDLFKAIADLGADVIVVASYHQRISSHVAKLAKLAVNMHPSLLPKYRGKTPSNWAIISGEKKTGVTLHKLSRHMDAGELLFQRSLDIGAKETDGELRRRLAVLGAEALTECVVALRENRLPAAEAQDEAEITVYPSVERRDGHIRFDQ